MRVMVFIVRPGDIKPITEEIIEETNQQLKALARLKATHIPKSISNPVAHAYKNTLKELRKQVKKQENERPLRESQEDMWRHVELMQERKEREKVFQIEIQLEALRRHSAEQQVKETQPQTENDGANSKGSESQENFKKNERESNTGLVFVRDVLKKYQVNNRYYLSQTMAWARVASGEFTHELIKELIKNKKGEIDTVLFTDGTKLTKQDFKEKYRKQVNKLTKKKPA